MSLFGELERIIVDWNDVYSVPGLLADADGPFDDISKYVEKITYTYGFNVVNNPDGFGFTTARGTLTLTTAPLPEGITAQQLNQPHIFRHELFGVVLFQGILQPVDGGVFNIISPNQQLLRNAINLTYETSVLDAELFYDALSQSGAQQGDNFVFNEYSLTAGLTIESSFGRLLNDFMKFGGGYAYEDRHCRINFVAARGLFYDNYLDVIEEDVQDLFTLDITSKEGAVRNDVAGEVIIPTSIVRERAGTYSRTVEAGSFAQLYYAVPQGKVASNWAVVLTAPNPVPNGITYQIIDAGNSDITFVLTNGSMLSVDISADLFVSTYEVAQRERLSDIRIDSVLLYGRQAFDDFPNWASDAGPVQSELNRLKDPLSVARIRLPIVPDDEFSPFGNDVVWSFLDVGAILRVQQGAFAKDMMIGRVVVVSIETFEIEWHLVDVPTSQSVTDVEVLAWYADNEANILGINTYLTDEIFVRGNFLTIGGKYLEIDGDKILIPSLDLLAIDDDFVTIDGDFIEIGLALNGS